MNTTSDTKPNGEISIDGSGAQNGLVRMIPALAGDPSRNDFATGYASVFYQGSSSRVSGRSRSLNAFLQDGWKVSPSFTLNIGLRWEFNHQLIQCRSITVAPVLEQPGDFVLRLSTHKPVHLRWIALRRNEKIIVRVRFSSPLAH